MQSKNISNKKEHWGEKPYYSLDYYLKKTFGEKVYKVALDAGMTCPNRDGSLGTRGCIFCSNGGSGDFATKCKTTITEQIDEAIRFLQTNNKNVGKKYIAYFQSYTNTYAPVDVLRSIYEEALCHPSIVALSIGTRPDCFQSDTYALLSECKKIMPIWIELGLQTMHSRTADFIRRGYPLSVFEHTVAELKSRKIPVIVHVILGLPGESSEDILETIHYLNSLEIDGIKLQLLHILKDTDLAKLTPACPVYSLKEYLEILGKCVAHLSPDIVIHRLTGDAPKNLLIAPTWSANKRNVLNQITHYFKENKIYQGKYYDI